MTTEHPFAPYVRILGKGKNGSRSMTETEATEAMRMILAGEVEPVQLGAFLMLMRVKEESPHELAGFVRAARASMTFPADLPPVRMDWSSYAGKRRQLPWFLLSALLLSGSGYSIFLHASGGRKDNRIYTPEALQSLGIKSCDTLTEAGAEIKRRNFAFMNIEQLCPKLHEIIELRPLLGLRSPVNTLTRMLNPFNSPVMLQGIFHPGYRDIHQEAALILGQPHMAAIKGEGGEIERNPDMPCLVKGVNQGVLQDEEWPRLFTGPRHLKDETMDIRRLAALWHGDITDEYAEASVTGTAAIALKTMGAADSIESAQALAVKLWKNRPVAWLNAA